MAEKYAGKMHVLKEEAKEKWLDLKEQGLTNTLENNVTMVKNKFIRSVNAGEDYEHHYRRKSRLELVRISAAVMGIEFSYAAETAFVSPTLLKIGVSQRHMTLIWCLSPLIGFFLTPILGSMSDRCRSLLGRRRPFIILLSIGVVIGLILVPNGKYFGELLGDQYYHHTVKDDGGVGRSLYLEDEYDDYYSDYQNNSTTRHEDITESQFEEPSIPQPHIRHAHPWGIFFTIIGTVLLDFDADACQSPSRAYLLDVTLPEDHAIGLSTFTIMAGLGGSLGYLMGAIDWGWIGALFGGHVRAVFSLMLVIFIFCVFTTLTSFNEIPLDVLTTPALRKGKAAGIYDELPGEDEDLKKEEKEKNSGNHAQSEDGYGAINQSKQKSANPFTSTNFGTTNEKEKEFLQVAETNFSQASPVPVDYTEELDTAASVASLKQYLWSIIYMPASLRWLCLTNLFCWSSLVCYSLYFTDFVGQAVFKGNPQADEGSTARQLYDDGVRFGCWGMSLYSLSCSLYSFLLDKLIKRFRAKPVYIGGQLVYSTGMVFMALTRSKWGVLLFSLSAGVMYSTLFTMPYLLVAHYHETDTIQCEDSWFLKQIRELLASIKDRPGEQKTETKTPFTEQVRGIGTDIAIVSCMVFLAQFTLSLCMGSIVASTGSTVSVVIAASVLSFCGAISANFVSYQDL